MKKFYIPIVLFGILVAILYYGMRKEASFLPSPLVGKEIPVFSLPRLEDHEKWTPKVMLGQVWILNVWASWCTPCRQEHPMVLQLSKQVPVLGFNYKELQSPANLKLPLEDQLPLAKSSAQLWLTRYQNPYFETVFDLKGSVGIELGIYGVPETYVLDKSNIIRYKQVGELTPEILEKTILPLVAKLKQS
ncbi:MAG: DsbE family thiol:disulfide interchange protein [Gammaproteobacteria bacterium]|nr:DsbE family thiol:disulfide interchange protein [Gammaproteobacteria bacterium]